jgi:hypothetical protein
VHAPLARTVHSRSSKLKRRPTDKTSLRGGLGVLPTNGDDDDNETKSSLGGNDDEEAPGLDPFAAKMQTAMAPPVMLKALSAAAAAEQKAHPNGSPNLSPSTAPPSDLEPLSIGGPLINGPVAPPSPNPPPSPSPSPKLSTGFSVTDLLGFGSSSHNNNPMFHFSPIVQGLLVDKPDIRAAVQLMAVCSGLHKFPADQLSSFPNLKVPLCLSLIFPKSTVYLQAPVRTIQPNASFPSSILISFLACLSCPDDS